MCPHWQLKPCSLLNWQHHQLVCPPSCWKQHCVCSLEKVFCVLKNCLETWEKCGLNGSNPNPFLVVVCSLRLQFLLNKAFMPGFLSQGHPAAFQEEKVQPHLRALTVFFLLAALWLCFHAGKNMLFCSPRLHIWLWGITPLMLLVRYVC